MKKFFSVIIIVFGISAAASAQDQNRQQHPGEHKAKQHMEAEMVAFLTNHLDLDVKEAEVFWPVYNKIEAAQKETAAAERMAFKKLNEALKNGVTGKEIDNLTDAYVKAVQANENAHMKAVKEYRKVLPSEKVAKLFVLQERFRRQQINNLRGGHPGNGQQGGRPGHGPRPEGRGTQQPARDRN